GLPGLIIGPFAGAVLGELIAHHDVGRAGRAGIAAWLGFLIGTVVKVGLAFAMVGIFLTAWFVSWLVRCFSFGCSAGLAGLQPKSRPERQPRAGLKACATTPM